MNISGTVDIEIMVSLICDWVVCPLFGVPFSGCWDRYNAVAVCSWTDDELRDVLDEAMDWDEPVLESLEDMRQMIDSQVNSAVSERPWEFS